MHNQDSYPDDYEEVFNLILSLVEQVRSDVNKNKQISAEELEEYFTRLSKGTIGEYEFTRRMAYESFPVIRIAALPILWQKYKQPVTPDFIVRLDGKSICVEVKNYDWRTYIHKLKIKKSSLENCRKFRDFMKLDAACVGIKRFEKWYLIDIEEYMKHAKLVNNHYEVTIKDVLDKNLLNEELVVFNTGNQADYSKHEIYPPPDSSIGGIIYKDIKIDKSSNEIILYGGNDKTRSELSYVDIQKDIIHIIYETIEKNIRGVFSLGYDFWDIKYIEDMLPTKFSITDKLRDRYYKGQVEPHFNTLTQSAIYCGNNEEVRYYLRRIADVLHYKYEKILKTKGMNFNTMKDLIRMTNDFKKSFK